MDIVTFSNRTLNNDICAIVDQEVRRESSFRSFRYAAPIFR